MRRVRDSRADFAEYAERIKSDVSVGDVLSLNGIQVNRHGFAVCPLHGDTDASLKVYGGNRGWVCYGCHKGGDVINLAMELYGLSFQDAMRKLNEEFSIGIDFDREPSAKESFLAAARVASMRAKRKKEEENAAAAERAFWKAFDLWLGCARAVDEMAETLDRAEGFPDDFCEAVMKRNEAYDHLIDAEERRMKHA